MNRSITVLFLMLCGCAQQTPHLGLNLTADLVGRSAEAFTGFPAVSLDASRLIAMEVSPDGETRLVMFETRDGEELGAWTLAKPGENPAPRLVQTRIEKALWALSSHTWITMVTLEPTLRELSRHSGHGVDLRYDGTSIAVDRNGEEALYRQGYWEVISAPAHCDAAQPACVCRNPANVASAWVSVDQRELLLRITYTGDKRCPAPIPRFEIMTM